MPDTLALLARESLQDAPFVFVVLAMDGTLRQVNRSFERLTGWSNAELVGRLWFDVCLPVRDRAAVRDVFASVGAGEKLHGRHTNSIVTRSGAERLIEWSNELLRDADGEPIAVLAIGQDVTERDDLRHRYRSTTAAMREGVILRSPTGEIEEYNAAAERILGLSSGAERWSALKASAIHEDGSPMAPEEQAWARCARTGEPVNGVVMGVQGPGDPHPRWLMVNAAPLRRERDGALIGVVSSFEDVTERLVAQRELADERNQLRQILDSLFGTTTLLALTGEVIEINLRPLANYGFTREAVVGRKLVDLGWFDAANRARVEEGMAAAARGETWRGSLVALAPRQGQSDVDAVFAPVRDGRGVVRNIVGSAVDVTERRRTEALLREAQQLARIGSWELDFVNAHISWSEGLHELYEVPLTDPASVETYRKLVHPDDLAANDAAFGASIGSRVPHEMEHRLRWPDGHVKWVHHMWRTTFDEGGTPLRWLGTVQDITERKLAEEQRARLEAQLRQAQKLESLGTLASGIAHDFNNLLAGILANAELALADSPKGSPVAGNLEEITTASLRAAELVKQILAFGRQQPMKRDLLSMRDTTAEVVRLLRATLPAGIELVTQVADELPSALMYGTQVHQVLMNLGTNAWHAIPRSQGTITFEVDAVDLAGDELALPLAAGRYLRVRVSDDGAGMDAATRERIFEPFFTTKEPGKGSGLGLAVAHGIVADHGGTIEVTSEPGVGSTFSVYLPAAGSGVKSASIAPKSAPARGNGRVLLVDDEIAFGTATRRLLERMGYAATCCSSPVEAIAMFRADPSAFDVVVTDQNMPELDGLAVAAAVHEARPGTPIVLVSGNRAYDDAELVAAHIDYWLDKPFSGAELGKVLQQALGR